MARNTNPRITIGADWTGDRATRQAEGDLKRLGDRGSRHLDTLKSAGLAAGAALAGAVVVGGAKAAAAAVESEKSQARLKAQLDALNISYEDHAKAIDTAIQKQSQLSGLDDEGLQDAFTNIVRVTGDVDKSLRLTGLAADFARAKQIDVAKAGELVGKVAGGNVGILARYGIEVNKGASAAEALAALQKKFAGQAEAYGKTTAGSLDRAKVASENLGEVVGAKLTPLLAKGATALVDLIDKSGQLGGPIRTATGVVSNAYDAVRQAISGFAVRNREDLAAVVDAARNFARFTRNVIEDVVIPLFKRIIPVVTGMAEGVAQVLRGLIRIVTGIVNGDWTRVWEGFKDIPGGIINAIKASLTGLWEAIRDGVKALAPLALNAAKEIGKSIVKGIVAGVKALPGAIKSAIGSALEGGLNIVKGILPGVNDVAAGFRDVAAARGGAYGSGLSTRVVGLAPVARDGLSFIRSFFGGVNLTSGRRSPAENSAVGGASNSDHLWGGAIDLVPAQGWTPAGVSLMDRIAAWARTSSLVRWIGWRGVPGHGPGDHLHLSFVRPGSVGDVTGKVSTFGPPLERAGTTASGVSSSRPGIAILNRATLGKMFRVRIGGRSGLLRQTDIGPAAWTGRKIDVTGAGARQLGIDPNQFPTDSTGTAVLAGADGGGGARTAPDQVVGGGSRGLGYEGRLARNDVAQAKAERADNLPALLKELRGERSIMCQRLKRVNKLLGNPRLKKAARTALLQEKAQLIRDIGDLDETIAEYRADRDIGGATTISGAEQLDAGVNTSATGAGGSGGESDVASLIALTQQLVDATNEKNARDARLEALVQTQQPQLLNALLAVVNGGIGGRIGLGFQAVGVPGVLARP